MTARLPRTNRRTKLALAAPQARLVGELAPLEGFVRAFARACAREAFRDAIKATSPGPSDPEQESADAQQT